MNKPTRKPKNLYYARSEVKVSRFFWKPKYGAMQRVQKESDTLQWHNSIAYHELIAYINRTSTAIQGIRQLHEGDYPVSPTMRSMCNIFDRLTQLLKSQKRTFNDKSYQYSEVKRPSTVESFRNWSRLMMRSIFSLVEQAVPSDMCEHIGELGQYLAGSFGNQSRLDYGTGHELSFLFFLCALFRSKVLLPSEEPAAALMLFNRYLNCVRQLQMQFGLKPAGFQGTYSLDDYQFVSYLWGTAQLCYDPPFKPQQLLDPEVTAYWRKQYQLADCVAFIVDTKQGEFATHSCQLWNIAALSSWKQVYHGLHNMYLKEVICQYHLLRHVYFGQLMSFDPAPPTSHLLRAQLGILSQRCENYLRTGLRDQFTETKGLKQENKNSKHFSEKVLHNASNIDSTSFNVPNLGGCVANHRKQKKMI